MRRDDSPTAASARGGASMLHRLFPRTAAAALASLAVGLGAARRYPGGTALDASTRGYSFSQNFLSDLGMTVAYDGESNRLGAALFAASLLLLVTALGASLAGILRSLTPHPPARGWTRPVSVVGFLVCAAFTGVAVTPENRAIGLHVAFTLWGWRLVPVGAAILGVAAIRAGPPHRRAGALWLTTAALLACYAGALTWGGAITGASRLAAYVIAQKVATIVLVGTFLAGAAEADRTRGGTVTPLRSRRPSGGARGTARHTSRSSPAPRR